jgi:hypothetical protein
MVRDSSQTLQSHRGHRLTSVRPPARDRLALPYRDVRARRLRDSSPPAGSRQHAAGRRLLLAWDAATGSRSGDRVTRSCQGATTHADPGYERIPLRCERERKCESRVAELQAA